MPHPFQQADPVGLRLLPPPLLLLPRRRRRRKMTARVSGEVAIGSAKTISHIWTVVAWLLPPPYMLDPKPQSSFAEAAAATATRTKRQRTARTTLGFAPVAAAPARPVAVEGTFSEAQRVIVNAVVSDLLRDVTGEVPVSELRVSDWGCHLQHLQSPDTAPSSAVEQGGQSYAVHAAL